MRYRNSRENGNHISTCANTRFHIDESVVEVLRGLYGAVIVIALIDPTDGSWSDELMASDEVLYTLCGKDYTIIQVCIQYDSYDFTGLLNYFT